MVNRSRCGTTSSIPAPWSMLLCCEPPTHRSVPKGSSPPPHHPHECPPEPPLSTPVGGGSSAPCPSGAWLASDDRGRQSANVTHGSPCNLRGFLQGHRHRLADAATGGEGGDDRLSVASSSHLRHQSKR